MIETDLTHIEYAIDNEKRLTLTIYKYLADERKYIDEIVEMYLKQTNMEGLTSQLTYCIHELAGNACRANSKRSYFKDKQLDIDNNDHYEEGMESFREEAFSEMSKHHENKKKHGLYIKFQIKKNRDSIDLGIVNNVPLTIQEEKRINEKFKLVKGFENVAEAFGVLSDSSEGAGLGIAMMIMMLREMGQNPDQLRIFRSDNETHAVLTLPLHLISA